ncbi:MAG: DUF349 domain-containing protein [Nocardioides sp.]
MTTHEWGRVADDGTVFVRTSDGERTVGQYPVGTAEEAMHFFTERYAALAFEVELLERRVSSGVLAPDEATESVAKLRAQVVDANAVGDLAALSARLDGLGLVIGEQREARKAERAAKIAEAKVKKEALVEVAERLSSGKDWRHGAIRLRELLEEWKALPRLDRASDDALWKRFSSARTTYTRRRKAHFAEQQEQRETARVAKERLASEAEALAESTEWGPTAGKYRDLMRRWKAAGPAPREVDELLWQRFRGAQDAFFAARDAANAAIDQEFAANAEVKEAILIEAEALLPIKDLDAAKRAFRTIAERWDAAGKVPRDKMQALEARIRKVEQAIRGHEEAQWKRSDPEKSARADDMITKLEQAIATAEADLAKARVSGDARKIKDLEENLSSRRAFLDMARRAADEFSG